MYESILAKADFVNTSMEMPYTVLIGVTAVFSGLICIVILCKIIGIIFGKTQKQGADKNIAAPVAKNTQTASQPIENRQQIIAAVSAVIAEELGTDVSAIRIKSFKKL